MTVCHRASWPFTLASNCNAVTGLEHEPLASCQKPAPRDRRLAGEPATEHLLLRTCALDSRSHVTNLQLKKQILPLEFSFHRSCFLRAFSPRYCACSYCSAPALLPLLCTRATVKPALKLSLECVWSFSAGSDFQKDGGSFESNDLNQKTS